MIQEPIFERNEESNTGNSTNIESYPSNSKINRQVKEQEKEIDDISDLVEKFKYLSLKIPEESGEDALIYGLESTYIRGTHSIYMGYIYSGDGQYLQFCSKEDKKNPIKLKIRLSSISDFCLGKRDFFGDLSLPIDDKCLLTILYEDNLKHANIIMRNENEAEMFIVGIVSIIQKKFKENADFDTDLIYLKRIWKEYDKDHKKYLNISEFEEFLRNINYDFKGKKIEKIFQCIKKEEEDKIKFIEFISFYESLVTGEEFEDIFQKYSSDINKKYITIKGLMDFYEKEQQELISSEEALKLICKFSKKANKSESLGLKQLKKLREHEEKGKEDIIEYNKNKNDINKNNNEINESSNNDKKEFTSSTVIAYENYNMNKNRIIDKDILTLRSSLYSTFRLSFRKFVNLLIDRSLNCICKKPSSTQDLTRPITQYFANASHNTYLEGGQISGRCSTEMYAYVLRNGVRFVDIDTFEAGRDIVVTHWHFPVGEIPLKDVLKTIKTNAFTKSHYPVILSIENHCGPEGQNKMSSIFLDILGKENLYIIDPTSPPLIYPSPEELKFKFIIKNKRDRIFDYVGGINDNSDGKIKKNNWIENEKNDENNKCLINDDDNDNLGKKSNRSSINGVETIIDNKININDNNKSDIIIEKENNDNNDNLICNNNNSDYSSSTFKKVYNNLHNSNDNKMNKKSLTMFDFNKLNQIKKNKELIIERMTQNTKDVITEEEISDKEGMNSDDFSEDIEETGRQQLILFNQKIKFKFIEDLPKDVNYIPCHTVDIIIKGENNTPFPTLRFKKNASAIPGSPKNEQTKYVNLTWNTLKKLKQKSMELGLFSEQKISKEKKEEILKKIEILKNMKKKGDKGFNVGTVENLSEILGMVGVKFYKSSFLYSTFLPWECLSISESEIRDYLTNFDKKLEIISLTKDSFLKIYPDGFRFDSSNQNPLYCWGLGAQFCALNMQSTKDDWVLLNKIFFKTNGGSRCGYVLKPSYLRNFSKEKFFKKIRVPLYKIKIKILSGFHLHFLIPKEAKRRINGISIELSYRSLSAFYGRENKEPKSIFTNAINKNYLHPIWEMPFANFDIYEEEFTFFVIKVLANKSMCLGRAVIPVSLMNFGYRVVELYDDACSKIEESYLIIHAKKILL